MTTLNVTMNGEVVKPRGSIYMCPDVKYLTIMDFKFNFNGYVNTSLTVESTEYNNQIELKNNLKRSGLFTIDMTVKPNKSQVTYLIKLKLESSTSKQMLFIMFRCLDSVYSNCNTGYVASSLKIVNHRNSYNADMALSPVSWKDQKRGWENIGRSIGGVFKNTKYLVGMATKAIQKLTHKRTIMNVLAPLKSLWVEVTFDEKTVDSYKITDHPVQYGVAITDHMIREPTTYTIRAGYSGSGLLNSIKSIGNLASNLIQNKGAFWKGATLLQTQYQQLLDMQRSGIEFTIITPKRIYKNMVIKTLTVETDVDTENVLNFTAECREIQKASIVVGTAAVEAVGDTLDLSGVIEAGIATSAPVIAESALKVMSKGF